MGRSGQNSRLSLPLDAFDGLYGLIYRFTEVGKMITDNGGRVVDLDEYKLTHVVLDRRDDSRRLEMMKRTSKYVPYFLSDHCGRRLTRLL